MFPNEPAGFNFYLVTNNKVGDNRAHDQVVIGEYILREKQSTLFYKYDMKNHCAGKIITDPDLFVAHQVTNANEPLDNAKNMSVSEILGAYGINHKGLEISLLRRFEHLAVEGQIWHNNQDSTMVFVCREEDTVMLTLEQPVDFVRLENFKGAKVSIVTRLIGKEIKSINMGELDPHVTDVFFCDGYIDIHFSTAYVFERKTGEITDDVVVGIKYND